MYIDLHCDTVSALYARPEHGTLHRNSLSVDLEKLRRGDSFAQFFALFVDRQEVKDPAAHVMLLLRNFYAALQENAEDIALAVNYGDVMKNRAAGKLSAFLAIEEGGAIRGSLETLREFYRRGVRMMTLTWNYPNEIGFPHHTHEEGGLTAFGRECVEEMNRIGMIVDVSHLSERGFYDVADIARVPFVASHANSRQMRAHSRNLTDDMIRVLAEKGGVMGVAFASDFLGTSPISRLDDIIRHIRHIHSVGGIEAIAIGTDYDGIESPVEIEDCGHMEKLSDCLRVSGFGAGEIDKILYKNSLRVIEDCLC